MTIGSPLIPVGTQGDQKPGGLLISTGEYYRITYSITIVYLVGYLPRLIWLIYKFVDYSIKVEAEPGNKYYGITKQFFLRDSPSFTKTFLD